jgi:alcohol dehydrogenase class IV
MDHFAQLIGFGTANELADEIHSMKLRLGVRTDLKDLNLCDADIDDLVRNSYHPNIKNSPVEITDEILYKMYRNFR